MTDAAWTLRIEHFYEREFDDADPQGSVARMRELIAGRPEGDAEALFELAGVHDSLGLEEDAIPLYRRALEAGLEGPSALRAPIQLASSLRNVGASGEAVSILEAMPDAGSDEGARQAFLALALHDEGRHGDALRTALLALIPTLDGYKRSLTEYAAELPGSVPPSSGCADGLPEEPVAPAAEAGSTSLEEELDRILAERDRDAMQPTIDALLPLHATHPDNARVLYEVGGAYDTAGQEDLARSFYEQALAAVLEGDLLRRCYLQYGSTLRNLGEHDASLQVFARAREAFPESPALKVFEAISLHAAGRSNASIASLLDLAARFISMPDIERYIPAIRGDAAFIRSMSEPDSQRDDCTPV